MKIITSFALLSLILISCGKYEKPFISFRSPEKRICQTWIHEKYLMYTETEHKLNESITFKIEGDDSIFIRTLDNVTYQGTWTWEHALKGKFDKERVRVSCVGYNKLLAIEVLTNKELEFIDESMDYRYFFKAK
jgi:hypothetical protein